MNNKKLPRRGLRPLDSGGIYLLVQVSIYVFQSIFMLIFGLLVKHAGVVDNDVTKMIVGDIIMLLNAVVFILTPFIYSRYTGIDFLGELDLRRGISAPQALLLILIAWCSIVAFMPVSSLFIELFEMAGYHFEMSVPIYVENFGYLVLSIIFVAILPAIGEEIVCRGFVARGMRKLGIVLAIVLSSLLFATMHGNLMQLVYQFFLGMVLVIVYFATRSIYASMTVHATNNATALIINYILYKTTGSQEFDLPLEGAALVFSMLAIGLLGFILLSLVMWAFMKVTKKRQDKYVGDRVVDISTMRVYGRHNKKGTNFVTRMLDELKYLNYSFEEEDVERHTVPVEAAQLRDAATDQDKQYYSDLLRAKGDRERRWDRNLMVMAFIFNAFVLTINIIGAFRA